eukprot:3657569-Rhodomonas_salina.4
MQNLSTRGQIGTHAGSKEKTQYIRIVLSFQIGSVGLYCAREKLGRRYVPFLKLDVFWGGWSTELPKFNLGAMAIHGKPTRCDRMLQVAIAH